MKKTTKVLGLLVLAGSMTAPVYAAQQQAGPVPPPHHQQLMHGHAENPDFHGKNCCCLNGKAEPGPGYSSYTVSNAKIGQGYLGPGRTDPLPPNFDGSKEAVPLWSCLFGVRG